MIDLEKYEETIGLEEVLENYPNLDNIDLDNLIVGITNHYKRISESIARKLYLNLSYYLNYNEYKKTDIYVNINSIIDNIFTLYWDLLNIIGDQINIIENIQFEDFCKNQYMILKDKLNCEYNDLDICNMIKENDPWTELFTFLQSRIPNEDAHIRLNKRGLRFF